MCINLWSKGDKHLGHICWRGSQHFGVWFVSWLLFFHFVFIVFCLISLFFSGENVNRTFLIISVLLSRSLLLLRLLPVHSWAHWPVQSPSALVLQSSNPALGTVLYLYYDVCFGLWWENQENNTHLPYFKSMVLCVINTFAFKWKVRLWIAGSEVWLWCRVLC